MRLSSADLLFLARFSKSPDGQALLKILEAKLAEVHAGLRTHDGTALYRDQGRAQQLDEIMSDITEATARLDRAQPPQRARL